MSEINRREMMALLAAFGAQDTGKGTLGGTRVLLPQLTKRANGSEGWAILRGTLDTGESVAMHESVMPAGTPAAAPHKIMHSELILVAEGTVELWADGAVSRAPQGSVIYVAYGTNHFLRNVGDGPARYVVWQMGGDTR